MDNLGNDLHASAANPRVILQGLQGAVVTAMSTAPWNISKGTETFETFSLGSHL